jgi:hypothetical protein
MVAILEFASKATRDEHSSYSQVDVEGGHAADADVVSGAIVSAGQHEHEINYARTCLWIQISITNAGDFCRRALLPATSKAGRQRPFPP